MLRVHHLNCGSMCPVGGRIWDGVSRGFTAELVCHTLAIETDAHGLVLIDTGFGIEDVKHSHERISSFFLYFNNIRLHKNQTALRQIERLGFKREDVRHIVLTHLDFDHAGGISDFPQAQVHLLKAELESASNPRNWRDRNRFRKQQWLNEANWATYAPSGEKWFGFDSVRDLKGLPPEILMIPLAGHTYGHSGVAIRTDREWLLHAGDAYFYRGEMEPDHYHCTPGLRFYQTMMEQDRGLRLQNQARLRELIQTEGDQVRVFSAHDRLELEYFPGLTRRPAAHRIPQPSYHFTGAIRASLPESVET